MIPSIQNFLLKLETRFDSIPAARKVLLEKIADYCVMQQQQKGNAQLIYICTHNSRRSHFGQIWAQVAADFYGIKNIKTYSGGTEATAFNGNAINALKRVGFEITALSTDTNPVYKVIYDKSAEPLLCFSKTYDHPGNSQSEFAAIMTCSDAEENCPFIPGLDLRVGTTYDDPKAFDGTIDEVKMYDQRCEQIALECLFVMSQAHKKTNLIQQLFA